MLTSQTSFNRTFMMKDDVNYKVPNGTPKTLNLSNGVLNWDGGVEVKW